MDRWLKSFVFPKQDTDCKSAPTRGQRFWWEVRSMLLIADDLKYIDHNQKDELVEACLNISKQLSGFIKYLKHKT